MQRFVAPDATRLAYHVSGGGDPLVCLPGGPGRASSYLGDLGGLAAHRRLVRLDNRGTGESDVPDDPAGYRCDRLVEDVEALREHLGLDTFDLLAHSAAGDLALLYAARHPDRLRRLVLVTPGLAAAGVELTDEEWHEAIQRRSGEPWYDEAYAALMAWDAGDDGPENRATAAPFLYGRWDDTARAHAARQDRTPAAAEGFYAEGAFDPDTTRAGLSKVTAPVLVLAGALDAAPTPRRAADVAHLFSDGRPVIDPDSAHFPWVTAPKTFADTVGTFLS